MINKILFRCDAGDHIGGGHMIRCLAFAEALKKAGFECSFMCNSQAWEFPALINSGFARIDSSDLKDSHFEWIVFDHYFLNADDEVLLRPYCEKVLVIDDLANRRHDCDILVDFSPSRKAVDYDGLVPADCKRCIGIDYLILRDTFFQPESVTHVDNVPKKIFITMGSIDGKEKIPIVLRALEKQKDILEINILMTCKTRTFDQIRLISEQSKHKINLHVDIPNPAEIMKSSDLAISAGGMTCLELVALQIPTLAIVVADNQKENVGYLSDNHYILHIKNDSDLNTLDFGDILHTHNFKKLKTGHALKVVSEML